MEDIVVTIVQITNFVCDVIVLLLPWMILSAIKSVKKSIDDASARRSFETKKLLDAMQSVNNNLFALRGEEIEG